MPDNNEKRVDWNVIRAEYVAGGISQRKLAEKYGVSYPTLRKQADSKGWVKEREAATRKAVEKAAQRTAESAASNAVTAQRIRAKLLARLEKEIDALPDSIGTNKRQAVINYEYGLNGKTLKAQKDLATEYKLRDLTAAWKDLTEGLIIAETTEETADDGFLEALSGTAAEDWAEDSDEETSGL